MPKVESLQELFVEELRDILDAEKQLTKALPKLAKASSSEELRSAFGEHLVETKGQIERLNRVFVEIGETARGKKCDGMQGLIKEGQKVVEEFHGSVRDAGLIAAAQKVEHYEMASYGTVRTYATLLGQAEAASLLEETLNEEKAADQKLTQIAEGLVNLEAAEGEEVDEDEGVAAQSGKWISETVGGATRGLARVGRNLPALARQAGRSVGIATTANAAGRRSGSRTSSAKSSGGSSRSKSNGNRRSSGGSRKRR